MVSAYPDLDSMTMVSGSPVSRFKGKFTSKRWGEPKEGARNASLFLRFEEVEFIVTAFPQALDVYEISLPYSLGNFQTDRWKAYSGSVNSITNDPTLTLPSFEGKVFEIIETNVPGSKRDAAASSGWTNTTVPGWKVVSIEGFSNVNQFSLFVAEVEDETEVAAGPPQALPANGTATTTTAPSEDNVLGEIVGAQGISENTFVEAALSSTSVQGTPLFNKIREQGIKVLDKYLTEGSMIKSDDGVITIVSKS